MTSLINEEGVLVEKEQLDNHIVSYFHLMFAASIDKGPMEFIESMRNLVNEKMRSDLSKCYTADEAQTNAPVQST